MFERLNQINGGTYTRPDVRRDMMWTSCVMACKEVRKSYGDIIGNKCGRFGWKDVGNCESLKVDWEREIALMGSHYYLIVSEIRDLLIILSNYFGIRRYSTIHYGTHKSQSPQTKYEQCIHHLRIFVDFCFPFRKIYTNTLYHKSITFCASFSILQASEKEKHTTWKYV